MTDLRTAVRAAAERLAEAGVPSPDVDAVALAAHLLGTGTGEVRRRMVLGEEAPPAYEDLVTERARRVPLQHLTGRAHFRRLTLAVGPGVFVPRPESEVTAQHAIDAVRRALACGVDHPVVVDLCTGSGAIALAVADECPGAEVHAVELSPEAHAWAERNVATLGAEIDLRRDDATTACEDLLGRVEVVVVNPPYIPTSMEPVDPEVRDHDPALALYGGSADGLAIPLAVAARASRLLRRGGVLVMEHADTQGAALVGALQAATVWAEVADHDDLSGRPRVTVAVRA